MPFQGCFSENLGLFMPDDLLPISYNSYTEDPYSFLTMKDCRTQPHLIQPSLFPKLKTSENALNTEDRPSLFPKMKTSENTLNTEDQPSLFPKMKTSENALNTEDRQIENLTITCQLDEKSAACQEVNAVLKLEKFVNKSIKEILKLIKNFIKITNIIFAKLLLLSHPILKSIFSIAGAIIDLVSFILKILDSSIILIALLCKTKILHSAGKEVDEQKNLYLSKEIPCPGHILEEKEKIQENQKDLKKEYKTFAFKTLKREISRLKDLTKFSSITEVIPFSKQIFTLLPSTLKLGSNFHELWESLNQKRLEKKWINISSEIQKKNQNSVDINPEPPLNFTYLKSVSLLMKELNDSRDINHEEEPDQFYEEKLDQLFLQDREIDWIENFLKSNAVPFEKGNMTTATFFDNWNRDVNFRGPIIKEYANYRRNVLRYEDKLGQLFLENCEIDWIENFLESNAVPFERGNMTTGAFFDNWNRDVNFRRQIIQGYGNYRRNDIRLDKIISEADNIIVKKEAILEKKMLLLRPKFKEIRKQSYMKDLHRLIADLLSQDNPSANIYKSLSSLGINLSAEVNNYDTLNFIQNSPEVCENNFNDWFNHQSIEVREIWLRAYVDRQDVIEQTLKTALTSMINKKNESATGFVNLELVYAASKFFLNLISTGLTFIISLCPAFSVGIAILPAIVTWTSLFNLSLLFVQHLVSYKNKRADEAFDSQWNELQLLVE